MSLASRRPSLCPPSLASSCSPSASARRLAVPPSVLLHLHHRVPLCLCQTTRRPSLCPPSLASSCSPLPLSPSRVSFSSHSAPCPRASLLPSSHLLQPRLPLSFSYPVLFFFFIQSIHPIVSHSSCIFHTNDPLSRLSFETHLNEAVEAVVWRQHIAEIRICRHVHQNSTHGKHNLAVVVLEQHDQQFAH